MDAYYATKPTLSRKQLLLAAHNNRELIRIPLNRPTDQLYRAVRNAGLIKGEEPLRLGVLFSNVNLMRVVFLKLPLTLLLAFKEHPLLDVAFWANKFKLTFGIDQLRGESHRDDFHKIGNKLVRYYNNLNTCSRIGCWSPASWMAKNGYLSYFLRDDNLDEALSAKHFEYLMLCLIGTNDEVMLEKMLQLKQRPEGFYEIVENVFTNVLISMSIGWLERWIAILLQWEDAPYYGKQYLKSALITGDLEKINRVYQLLSDDVWRSHASDIILRIIKFNNQELFARVWADHPVTFSYSTLFDFIKKKLNKLLPIPNLFRLIERLASHNPSIYEITFKCLSDYDGEIVIDCVASLDRLLEFIPEDDRESTLSESLSNAISKGNRVVVDKILSYGTKITNDHLSQALNKEHYQLLQFLLNRFLVNPQ